MKKRHTPDKRQTFKIKHLVALLEQQQIFVEGIKPGNIVLIHYKR